MAERLSNRIQNIDVVRGIVMVIMALDHVRDLIHVDAIAQSPTNLETTTPILFFTRWITYLCAPIFVFLAGTSVWMKFGSRREWDGKSFLLKRGLYLIVLEFVVVNFLLFFDPGYHTILFEVIAAIGFGFIVLALLFKLPSSVIGVIGLMILLVHNVFPLIPFGEGSIVKNILSPFFTLSVYPFAGRVLVIAYPPIPWIAIMLVGFASGKFFLMTEHTRNWLLLRIGMVLIIMFAAVRFINIYGDPAPWSVQKDSVYTFLSFMNVTKYPPSLAFCLITLGIMFVLLAIAGKLGRSVMDTLSVYGRVPLFYFLLHFLVIHIILIVILFMQGFEWNQLQFASGTFGRPREGVSGVSLGMVYVIWIAVVVALYLPCLWYGRYKARSRAGWVSYL